MRLLFMGTPAFAVPALHALIAAGHDIAGVWTRAPQPAGRGKALAKSPVHLAAEAAGLPVHTPRTLRDPAAQAEVGGTHADAAVVAAYGLILPQALLDLPARGCFNIHASLLPRWRGAAPIQRAILAGDTETGVTIMRMEAGLDTGPMLMAQATPIAGKTAGALTAELAAMGAALMVEALAGDLAAAPQGDGATHAAKIDKAEARLDFAQGAVQLERAVRAFNPAPGAFCEILGERLKILAADIGPATLAPGEIGADLAIGTHDGDLLPTLVQRAGKPAMPVRDLLNGWAIPAGTRIAMA